MNRILLALIPAAAVGAVAAMPHARSGSSDHCVSLDGDTIVCQHGLRRIHLRLNGIDSPEMPGHCRAGRQCAPGDPFAAKANMAALIQGRRVTWLDLGTDHYGRTIAEARAGGLDLQCAQLRGGFAIYVSRWDNKRSLRTRCPAAQ